MGDSPHCKPKNQLCLPPLPLSCWRSLSRASPVSHQVISESHPFWSLATALQTAVPQSFKASRHCNSLAALKHSPVILFQNTPSRPALQGIYLPTPQDLLPQTLPVPPVEELSIQALY